MSLQVLISAAAGQRQPHLQVYDVYSILEPIGVPVLQSNCTVTRVFCAVTKCRSISGPQPENDIMRVSLRQSLGCSRTPANWEHVILMEVPKNIMQESQLLSLLRGKAKRLVWSESIMSVSHKGNKNKLK